MSALKTPWRRNFFWAVSFILVLSACAAAPQNQTATDAANVAEYILAPDDAIAMTVYGEKIFPKTYKIDASAQLPCRSIGEVKLEGLTLREAEDRIV